MVHLIVSRSFRTKSCSHNLGQPFGRRHSIDGTLPDQFFCRDKDIVCDIELNVRTQYPDKIAEADDVLTTIGFERRRSDEGVSSEARDKLLVNGAP
jgi:hypothetical protein